MPSELNGRLLDILCCPITRRPLKRLDDATLHRLNTEIERGAIRNHGGIELTDTLEEALVTSEGDLVYPVRAGVPVLFEEACIHWAAYK